MAQIKALDKKAHANLKFTQDITFDHVSGNHILPLVVQEMVQASQSYPILFVKDQNTDQFKVVALTGLRPGENLFSGSEGWNGSYVPLQVRTYPFVLVKNPEDADQAVLCIDEDSGMLSESEGEPLFDADGEQTDYLKNCAQAVVEAAQRVSVTEQFVEFLVSKDLLTQKKLTLRVTESDKPYDLTGFFVVDEEKLNKLSDEDFLELRKRGALPAIYASIMSSMQVQSLIRKKRAG
ncbi:SapC family protein [Microbulbifer spongiae]|uniref:SapC family protein n=1 Tax=Microbulbifer spongiae TaxID=2944933 RepID=A0ABY9EI93_9GAMM|nr:SapC family protein [Microbulbifer sp. MI-G]WKD50721.1 SapC family protein [Microbulbifer sp. MI-G]